MESEQMGLALSLPLSPEHVPEQIYVLAKARDAVSRGSQMALFHCMVRHGTVQYGSLLGGYPLGTVPGTFLVPPRPGFQAIRTVTKM